MACLTTPMNINQRKTPGLEKVSSSLLLGMKPLHYLLPFIKNVKEKFRAFGIQTFKLLETLASSCFSVSPSFSIPLKLKNNSTQSVSVLEMEEESVRNLSSRTLASPDSK